MDPELLTGGISMLSGGADMLSGGAESDGGSGGGSSGGGVPGLFNFSESKTPVFPTDLYDTAAAPTFPSIQAPNFAAAPALGSLGTPATFTPTTAGPIGGSGIGTGPTVGGLQAAPYVSPMAQAMQSMAPAYAPSTVASTGTQAQLMPAPQGVQQVAASPLGAPGQAQSAPQGQSPMLYGGASIGASGSGGTPGYIAGGMQAGNPAMTPQALLGAPQQAQMAGPNGAPIPLNGEGSPAPQQGQGQPQQAPGVGGAAPQPQPPKPTAFGQFMDATRAADPNNPANQYSRPQFEAKINNEIQGEMQRIADRLDPQFKQIQREINKLTAQQNDDQDAVDHVMAPVFRSLDPRDFAQWVNQIMHGNPAPQNQVGAQLAGSALPPQADQAPYLPPMKKMSIGERLFNMAFATNGEGLKEAMLGDYGMHKAAVSMAMTAVGNAMTLLPLAIRKLNQTGEHLDAQQRMLVNLDAKEANLRSQAVQQIVNRNLSILANQKSIEDHDKNMLRTALNFQAEQEKEREEKRKAADAQARINIDKNRAASYAQQVANGARLAQVAESRLGQQALQLGLNAEKIRLDQQIAAANSNMHATQAERLERTAEAAYPNIRKKPVGVHFNSMVVPPPPDTPTILPGYPVPQFAPAQSANGLQQMAPPSTIQFMPSGMMVPTDNESVYRSAD